VIPVSERPRERGGLFGGDGLGPLGVLFCLIFCALAALVLDYGVLPPNFIPSSISPIDVPSRASFHYNDPDELNRLRVEAAARAPRVYDEETEWVENILRDLEKMAAIVEVTSSEGEAKDKAAAEKLARIMGSLSRNCIATGCGIDADY